VNVLSRQLQEFENFLISEGDELNTVRSYLYDLKQLEQFLQQRKKSLTDGSTEDLRDFIHGLFDLRLSPASINRKISSIKTFYRFLVFQKRIESDPASDLELLKTGRKLPAFMSIKEVTAIIEAADDKSPAGLRDRVCLEL